MLSFLTGTLLAAAGVVLADYKTGVMFIAGGIALLILEAALVLNLRNARALARFIVAVCDSLDHDRRASRSARNERREGDKPASAASAAPQSDPVIDPQTVQDLASALKNFGMSKKEAQAVAEQAAAEGGTLADMIRRATVRSNARVN